MDKKRLPERVKERTGPYTYDDYANLPDDGKRYELADGILQLLPSATPSHQSVSASLQYILTSTCQDEYVILGAPLDVILSPTEVRQPDLIAVHRERLDIITRRAVEGPPDLVVEILSPSSRKRDKIDKAAAYVRYGIPEYWIVDAAGGTLEQYLMRGDRYVLAEVYGEAAPIRSARLPCAQFTMKDVLARTLDLPDA